MEELLKFIQSRQSCLQNLGCFVWTDAEVRYSERPRSTAAQLEREPLGGLLRQTDFTQNLAKTPPAGRRRLSRRTPAPQRTILQTDGHGAEGGGRSPPAVPGARAADIPEGPERQRGAGCCGSGGGRGGGRGGQGEEGEEEEPVRRGAVPARLGRRLQGRQDHLARRLLPDHQDQPLQGRSPREGVGDSAQGRCASR